MSIKRLQLFFLASFSHKAFCFIFIYDPKRGRRHISETIHDKFIASFHFTIKLVLGIFLKMYL